MARKARGEELAAARALKKQQRDAATSQKVRDRASKASQTTSRSAVKEKAPRRRVVGGRSGVAPTPAAPPAPLRSTRTRNVKPPQRYSE
jgi:hypothetical protein